MESGSDNPQFMNGVDLQKMLKISQATMYRLVETETIPFYRIGKKSLRFRYDEIMSFMKKCKFGPDQQENI